MGFLRKTMRSDDPEVTTVTSKGRITIPSRLRLVEEFQQCVEERADEIDLSVDESDRPNSH